MKEAITLENGQVAVIRKESNKRAALIIYEEDGIDEGAYCPAKSITVLEPTTLRDFLNEHFPKPEIQL